MPERKGRFVKGGTPGPGRPKGSIGGRKKFLQMFDDLCADKRAMERMKLALAAKVAGDPEAFIKEFLMPLLPKESLVQVEGEQKAAVRIVGLDPAADAAAAAEAAKKGADDI
jgi:hypothetical protein